MTNRSARVLVPILLAGLVLAAGAQAQPVQDQEVDTAFTGKVTGIDTKAMTLHVHGANGEDGVFHVDEKATTIMSGSEEIALSGIHEGEWISVSADTRAGHRVATYIEVVEDPSAATGSSSAQPTAEGAAIEVGHSRLSPALVEIAAGETVTFHNVDRMPGGHTIEDVDGSFASPPLDKDESWSHSFDVPGTYRVRIKEHPDTEASIVVE